MIFHIRVAGFDLSEEFRGCSFSMGVGECDYQTDGKWDPEKIGRHILYVIAEEKRRCLVMGAEEYYKKAAPSSTGN